MTDGGSKQSGKVMNPRYFGSDHADIWRRTSFRIDALAKVCAAGAYENTSTEKSSTGEGGGWKMQVRKKQVQMCKDGKCKYGKMK